MFSCRACVPRDKDADTVKVSVADIEAREAPAGSFCWKSQPFGGFHGGYPHSWLISWMPIEHGWWLGVCPWIPWETSIVESHLTKLCYALLKDIQRQRQSMSWSGKEARWPDVISWCPRLRAQVIERWDAGPVLRVLDLTALIQLRKVVWYPISWIYLPKMMVSHGKSHLEMDDLGVQYPYILQKPISWSLHNPRGIKLAGSSWCQTGTIPICDYHD